MKFHGFIPLLVIFLLSACSPDQPPALPVQVTAPAPLAPSAVPTALAAALTSAPALPLAPSPPPQIPIVPSPTSLQFKPAVRLVKQGPEKVVCPILLYHHIADDGGANPYYVSPAEFRAQMQALKDWGYQSITADMLAEALNFGARLPDRPVVITFDDGDETVYTQAYPVMREFGFTGVNYLVENFIGKPGYMTVEQLKDLLAAGWEAGSHTISHPDLIKSPNAYQEIVQSRRDLEKLLGVSVNTFAYPYGKQDDKALHAVAQIYRDAMGLGSSSIQEWPDRYYLWRRPVMPGWDIQTFGSFLPWNSPASN